MTVTMSFTLPRRHEAVGEARRLTSTVLAQLGAPTEHTEVVALALSEACTNAVQHASGHAPFTLQIDCSAGSVRLTVTSSGPFLPHRSTVDMPDAAALRGRGVPLMRVLMDEFDIVSGETGTTVTMCKNFEFDRSAAVLSA